MVRQQNSQPQNVNPIEESQTLYIMKINSVSKYDMTDVGSAYGQISGKKAEIAKMEGA